MTAFRRSGAQITLLILSLIGVGISVYLTVLHYENVLPICSTTGLVDCASVLTSPYSLVPGTSTPISIPGLGWFALSALLALLAWRVWPERYGLRSAQLAWAVLGMLTVFYLVYVELVRLHRICAWCTGLHAVIFVILLITLVLLQRPDPQEEPDFEEEQSTVGVTRD
jgi:uncharacterized membrane protein